MLKQLNSEILETVDIGSSLQMPPKDVFQLPEKVLQFGTGVLLRGLPDYFIDKANRQGIFNGRVVVVKSTASGGTDAFSEQDGLYTQVIRGIEDGNAVDEYILNSAISRVLSASNEWAQIMECARNPEIKIIVSNTTEVGISLQQEDKIYHQPPNSFPGKLLAVLFERYKTCEGKPDGGFVIVPTELIPDNGSKLKEIVLALADLNGCTEAFKAWINSANDFCNSLVDRIVPGKLSGEEQSQLETRLGYRDALMIESEVFRLWAIESTSSRVIDRLSFAKADAGVVLTHELEKFRELKLRLLNGTHTASCALAILAGFETVGDAMHDKVMGTFIQNLALEEIAPAITSGFITREEATQFAHQVFDRFRNPFLAHKWINIAAQYTSKMKMRVLPLIEKHYAKTNRPLQHLAIGVAAYLHIIHLMDKHNTEWKFTYHEKNYILQDDSATWLVALMQHPHTDDDNIKEAFQNGFWDMPIHHGFVKSVQGYYRDISELGAYGLIKIIQEQKLLSTI
jgi:tagaturonate reductase